MNAGLETPRLVDADLFAMFALAHKATNALACELSA